MFTKSTRRPALTLPLVALLAAACGGGTGGGEPEAGSASTGAAAPAASSVDPSTAGNVAGRVTFTGTPQAATAIDMSGEPECAAKHGGAGTTTDQAVVGPDGGLANVFVYVKEGLSGQTFPTPQPVVLDQVGCVYEPHVLGLQVGQTMTIRNSDGLLHNINASPKVNRPFNVSQPVVMDTNRTFTAAEVMIPVRCDVHGWMHAYVGILDHPYHSVSASNGSFSLATLPPGDYVVEAWHEVYGTLTQNVTVATGATAEITFEFNEKMAGNPVPLGEPWIIPHTEGHDHPVAPGQS
jgi:hypothetical protein